MNDEPLALVERVLLGWSGVSKKRDENGPGGVGVTGYRFGSKRMGHVHDDDHVDFRFPREVRDGLIRSGRALPHPAFPDGTTTVSYCIETFADVPGAVELYEVVIGPIAVLPHGLRARERRRWRRQRKANARVKTKTPGL